MADVPPVPATAMEDILASIKRIIAEPAPAPPAPPPARAPEEVLELGPAPAPTPAIAPAAEPAPDPRLVSAATRAASARAMATLAGVAVDPQAPANTLDGLVRELLRPMLKDWLDAHLPEIVERAVAHEIARLGPR